MASGKHILLREFAASDHSDYIVILYRTHPEMVPDVEFELEILPSFDHLFDNGILVLMQLDVRYCRKIVECHLVEVLPVV